MEFFRRTLLLLTLSILFAGTAPGVEGEPQIAAAAAGFVSLIDSGETGRAWQEFAPVARIVKAAEQWQMLHRTLRTAYGPVEKRSLRGITMQERYPLLPDGRYAIVQFDTTFRAKRLAIETVVMLQSGDGRWLIHDYVIN